MNESANGQCHLNASQRKKFDLSCERINFGGLMDRWKIITNGTQFWLVQVKKHEKRKQC